MELDALVTIYYVLLIPASIHNINTSISDNTNWSVFVAWHPHVDLDITSAHPAPRRQFMNPPSVAPCANNLYLAEW